MKIAILNSFYFPDERGGAEHSVRSLAEGLAFSGEEVSVICLGRRRETQDINGVRVERFPIKNWYLPDANALNQPSLRAKVIWHIFDSANYFASIDIRRFLTSYAPSVFHTNNMSGFSTAVWSAASSLRVPIVHTIRDFYLMCPRTSMRRSGQACAGQCKSCGLLSLPRLAMSKKVNHVVGISEFILNCHIDRKYFFDSAKSVIHNSFDPGFFESRSVAKKLVMGFIGRLVPEKGLELLLETFRKLKSVSPRPIHLLVAGEGRDDYVSTLRSRAEGCSIEFVGRQNPDDFFRQVDFTVVPSVWDEPLGRVVIESIAHGRPVVVTPVGGIPELVEPAFGEVCAAVSSDALVESVLRMVRRIEKESELMSVSAQLAASQYTSRSITERYMGVYAGVQGGLATV